MKLTDEELTDLVIAAGCLGARAKYLALEAVYELRELRAVLATPWPEHLDTIRTRDTQHNRIIVPLGGVEHVIDVDTAVALAAGILRAALAAKEQGKP